MRESTPTNDDRLIRFPVDFTIKVFVELLGREPESLLLELRDRAEALGNGAVLVSTAGKPSAQGRYFCHSMTFHVESRAQLDELYLELGKHPGVKMLL